MKLFSEKGFFSTSVQEIAERSGVAKGSIYNYFPSKEDLLIAVTEFYQNEMIYQSTLIANNTDLSPKEILKKQIQLQFESFYKSKDLIKIQVREQPNHENAKLKGFMNDIRKKMLGWHKERLVNTFGDSIIPYIDDMVVIFNGVMKEYLTIYAFEGKKIDIEAIADFIVERIETIIKDLILSKSNPILVNYLEDKEEFSDADLNEQAFAIIAEMKVISNKNMLVEAKILVQKLENELKNAEKEIIIIKALLEYLHKNTELKYLVEKLSIILDLS